MSRLLVPWGWNRSFDRIEWRHLEFQPSELAAHVANLSFVALYDGEPAAGPDVYLHDFAWPALLDAGIRATGTIDSECVRALRIDRTGRIAAVSEMLSTFGEVAQVNGFWAKDARLEWSSALMGALENLYASLLVVPRVGPAVATKLLHRKAPGLLPILDRWAVLAYGGDPDLTDRERMATQLALLTFSVHSAVAAQLTIIAELQDSLASRVALSTLRLYDVVCWLVWDASDGIDDPVHNFATSGRRPRNWCSREQLGSLVGPASATIGWHASYEDGSLLLLPS